MKERKLFGFDKHMLSIYDGSIISFTEKSKQKAGHLWYWTGVNPSWIISFNHLYSENNISYEEHKHNIRNIKVVGYEDEKLLK